MKETASTTGASPFCQRMTHNLAQDSLFNKFASEKCVLRGATFIGRTFIGRKAGKMRKVQLWQLLCWAGLSGQNEWLDKIHLSCGQGPSGNQNNQDDLQTLRNILRLISLDWANLRVAIAVIDWGWYCSTVPRAKALQTALCDSRFGFAHLRHETLQNEQKGAKLFLPLTVTVTMLQSTCDQWESTRIQRAAALRLDVDTSAGMDETPISLPTRPTLHWTTTQNCY